MTEKQMIARLMMLGWTTPRLQIFDTDDESAYRNVHERWFARTVVILEDDRGSTRGAVSRAHHKGQPAKYKVNFGYKNTRYFLQRDNSRKRLVDRIAQLMDEEAA